jgi:hypothetical protein
MRYKNIPGTTVKPLWLKIRSAHSAMQRYELLIPHKVGTLASSLQITFTAT